MNEKISDIKKIQLLKSNSILIIDQKLFDLNDEIIDKTAFKLQRGSQIVELYPDYESDKETFRLSQRLRELTSIFNCLFLIKNRLDIAKLVDSDGVVLDFKSIELTNARKLIDKEKFFAYELSDKSELLNLDNNFDFFQFEFNTKQNYSTDRIIFQNNFIERLK